MKIYIKQQIRQYKWNAICEYKVQCQILVLTDKIATDKRDGNLVRNGKKWGDN